LGDLLDNAVRAYVCGAPAAAIAMCRAVLEMVLKTRYLAPNHASQEYGLKKIISLAESRSAFLRKLRLSELKEAGDEILHRYHRRDPLSASDEKQIIDYMRTLKTLIQKVER
jgi:hypothetical protein